MPAGLPPLQHRQGHGYDRETKIIKLSSQILAALFDKNSHKTPMAKYMVSFVGSSLPEISQPHLCTDFSVFHTSMLVELDSGNIALAKTKAYGYARWTVLNFV